MTEIKTDFPELHEVTLKFQVEAPIKKVEDPRLVPVQDIMHYIQPKVYYKLTNLYTGAVLNRVPTRGFQVVIALPKGEYIIYASTLSEGFGRPRTDLPDSSKELHFTGEQEFEVSGDTEVSMQLITPYSCVVVDDGAYPSQFTRIDVNGAATRRVYVKPGAREVEGAETFEWWFVGSHDMEAGKQYKYIFGELGEITVEEENITLYEKEQK